MMHSYKKALVLFLFVALLVTSCSNDKDKKGDTRKQFVQRQEQEKEDMEKTQGHNPSIKIRLNYTENGVKYNSDSEMEKGGPLRMDLYKDCKYYTDKYKTLVCTNSASGSSVEIEKVITNGTLVEGNNLQCLLEDRAEGCNEPNYFVDCQSEKCISNVEVHAKEIKKEREEELKKQKQLEEKKKEEEELKKKKQLEEKKKEEEELKKQEQEEE